jgi:hypothetical protein
METTQVAEEIEKKIKELDILKEKIKMYADKKAQAQTLYDLELAKIIIGLKNGLQYQLGDKTIENPPATLIEKIARGICWEKGLEKEKADAEYKGLITKIETVCAQLNGWQSINRHLD